MNVYVHLRMFYMKREQKSFIPVLKKMLFLKKLPANVKLFFFILAAITFTHPHLKCTLRANFYTDIQEVLLSEVLFLPLFYFLVLAAAYFFSFYILFHFYLRGSDWRGKKASSSF